MRIAIFSDSFYPELSGISDSVIVLSKELAARGHIIHFYAPKYSEKNYKKAGLAETNPVLGANISFTRFASVPYMTGTGQGRLVFPTGLRWLAMKKFKYDVIHSQLFFGAGLEALFAARFLNVPLVGTNHTAITAFLKYAPLRADWIENLMVSYVNWYYSKCKITTAPSNSVIEEMRRYGFKGDARVVSNPIDTGIFRPFADKAALKKKFGFSDSTIIFAGRLSPEKNVDVLIRAMPQILKHAPGAMLAIAGHGQQLLELKGLANSLGAGEHVKFLGTLSKEDLSAAYNASEVFAIASTSETQGLVMLQALACGLPAVAVNARGLPEYVNSQNGALAIPGNSADVAEKITFILKDENLRARLSANAIKSIEEFSPQNIASIWEGIYSKAVAKR